LACAGYQNYLDLGQCYLPQPSASADNIDLGLNNSGYPNPAQPHPIIVNSIRKMLQKYILNTVYNYKLLKYTTYLKRADCSINNLTVVNRAELARKFNIGKPMSKESKVLAEIS
jgi:hypothetical protein